MEQPEAFHEVLQCIEDYIHSSHLTAKDGTGELCIQFSEVPALVHLISEQYPNLLMDIARLNDDHSMDSLADVHELIQGPTNPDTLFGASQIPKMILCIGSSNKMLAQMFIQTPQSPNTVVTASPTQQSLDKDHTNLGGWEHGDGIYVTTHHKETEQAKQKKQRYGEYATTMIDKDKINSQEQSLKDIEITLKELERNLVSSKNDFEWKLQEGSSFYQWISEPLGQLLLSQTSVVMHFKALENSMEVIKGVQNTHTALFLQALAGIDNLSQGMTNLMDHVHDADFMMDSLCKIKATIDALRSDLDCLKGSCHALDVQTHTTLEEELMLVPDCLVPNHQAGVDKNNWSKTGYWVSTVMQLI
ncbi:hypothetical protein F5J12DRAFT_894131 [Pisolithus orientalis]|uniref:uncharacterized protein n=1 Tax=Pisolithus orientalis TaxID=936130 RepID=UPI00222473B1|nr:uncharacterized protein F5J12DRAFT_894131 [Pisolithus orientalis]KAI6002371.1 hypothetical protein F5J12DRAFT_894131 [Pisolithus orientalis]